MKTVVAEAAVSPSSETVKWTAWVYAAILVVMAVGQLFSFEKFIPLVGDYRLPGGEGTATLLAAVIVISEVFALPFLLRMPLSRLMRWVSLVCGVVVALVWIFLGIIAVVADWAMSGSGLLGTKVSVPSGWLQLIIALGLGALSGVSVWGLWPLYKK